MILNPTDPWNEVDGERASIKSKHPAFTDKAVRDAMNLLIDRKGIADVIYGRGAITTANFLNNPPRFRSTNTKFEFNPDKANQMLEAAGWKKGADGIRAKGNVKLKFVYQTSVSGPRQKCQAIIKDACTKAGIDLELKSIVASVFFGSDFANPDTYQKFWADMQMFTTTMTQPDPQTFMEQFTTWELAQKANKWASRNLVALDQPRVRRGPQGRPGGARPGQARGAVHQDERPGGQRRPRHPAVCAAAAGGHGEQARLPDLGLGQPHRVHELLVPGGVDHPRSA